MKKRILSFTLLWLLSVIALYLFGTHAGVLLIASAALLTQFELYQLLERMHQRPKKRLGIACGALIIFGSYYFGSGVQVGLELFLLSYIILAIGIACGDLKAGVLNRILPTLFGLTYVPFLLHYLIQITKHAEVSGFSSATGIYLTVWVIAVAKATDVGGLLVGMQIGKTPLSTISPAKTYEGAAGGIITAALLGLVLNFFFQKLVPDNFTYFYAVIFAIPIAVASIASDLVESAFKRQAGVKDSGHIIPGIGGVFDLTDSLILTAPLAYRLFKYTIFV
jgi:phosphatidate cytidylyltransferase